jgi:hypothetical protein
VFRRKKSGLGGLSSVFAVVAFQNLLLFAFVFGFLFGL